MLNIAIIIVIALLAYWNYYQKLFTAFVHMVLVICCGALAFALWEPLATGMFMGISAKYAWAAALVIPFAFLLLISRILIDHFVPENVDFGQLTNLIGGGLCGVVSSILSTGIVVLALWHMPFPAEAYGIRPYNVNPSNGRVQADPQGGGSLMIPVDEIALQFFGALSEGSLSSGNSLKVLRPDLIRVAHEIRLRPTNASTAASPGTVNVSNHIVQSTPIQGLPQLFISAFRAGEGGNPLAGDQHKLVVIDTEWTLGGATFDSDSKLRVSPTQVRLVTFGAGDKLPKLHAPIAFSNVTDPTTEERGFTLVNRDELVANNVEGQQETIIAWTFIIPKTETEQFVMIRNLRFMLPDAAAKATGDFGSALATAIGSDLLAGETTGGTTAGPDGMAVKVEISAKLPTQTSKNLATGLDYDKNNNILGGEAKTTPPSSRISKATLVDSLEEKAGEAIVRVIIGRDAARDYYGRVTNNNKAVQQAAQINGIFLRDNLDGNIFPIGYAVLKPSRAMEIKVNRSQPMRSVINLPISGEKMAPGDVIYLYFSVKRGVRLISLNVGSDQIKVLNSMQVPK